MDEYTTHQLTALEVLHKIDQLKTNKEKGVVQSKHIFLKI